MASGKSGGLAPDQEPGLGAREDFGAEVRTEGGVLAFGLDGTLAGMGLEERGGDLAQQGEVLCGGAVADLVVVLAEGQAGEPIFHGFGA